MVTVFSFHGITSPLLPTTPHTASLFFPLSFCKGDFPATSLSLFGGGLLRLPGPGLPRFCVCSEGLTSHEGHFLSTTEDSKTQIKQASLHSVSQSNNTHAKHIKTRGGNIWKRGSKGSHLETLSLM